MEAHAARIPPLPGRIDAEVAWGGSDGSGVRVCVLDSGVDADHPAVAPVAEAWSITEGEEGVFQFSPDTAGDACGHGTGCCGIVRRLAPGCELISVKVLPDGFTGSGAMMLAGLRFAIERGYEVINMSLSTSRPEFVGLLHDLADTAYFGRSLIVASAHNLPVESYPWRFASVISVGSHERDDPELIVANGSPPVEFFARGVAVEVPWPGGAMITATGNSFATPHVSGLCARILSKHPGLTPFQVKTVLTAASGGVGAPR
ncbi:S8 family peptidase [Miltoncostaea oceani]|uniref:S8 family peptidase n=1 Tax=Miltoncostaea oceani TaxID=2843216 RepID=UPI003CCEDE1C